MSNNAADKYEAVGRYVVALLGANREWSSAADFLQQIGEQVDRVGFDLTPRSLGFWRDIADDLGIEHDGTTKGVAA